MKYLCSCALLLLFCIAASAQAPQPVVTYKNGHYRINDSIAQQEANLFSLLELVQKQPLKQSVKGKDVPRTVCKFYADITEEPWQMADTGGAYNCCCDIDEKLPNRQLICLGYKDNIVLMSYRHGMGAFGAVMVAVFRLEEGRVTDFWAANVGFLDEVPVSQAVILQQLQRLLKDKDTESYVLDL